ncbi:MAG: hypothetical protein HY243_19100 [Proteobacteria bacterium]|nr:hypothetical protein [Pseudomonadota bacterium]
MADNNGGSATPFLAFLVGGLIAAVAVLGVFVANGSHPWGPANPTKVAINVKPLVPKHP